MDIRVYTYEDGMLWQWKKLADSYPTVFKAKSAIKKMKGYEKFQWVLVEYKKNKSRIIELIN